MGRKEFISDGLRLDGRRPKVRCVRLHCFDCKCLPAEYAATQAKQCSCRSPVDLIHPFLFGLQELRNIKSQIGVLASADGSAMFQMGNTQVCFDLCV